MLRQRLWRAVYQEILAPRSNQLSVTDLRLAVAECLTIFIADGLDYIRLYI